MKTRNRGNSERLCGPSTQRLLGPHPSAREPVAAAVADEKEMPCCRPWPGG